MRDAQRHLGQRTFDLFVVDNLMPGMTGLELIREMSQTMTPAERPQIVMMTAHGSTQIVREAFKLGVEDFLEKPFEVDELIALARRAVEAPAHCRPSGSTCSASATPSSITTGSSAAAASMQDVIQRAELVAQTKSTVLITGETGTGKEMVARLIHHRSAQRDMPLIKVNCAAIPGDAARVGAVRPPARRVHRRVDDQARQVRAGRRRLDLPRRDRHAEHDHPGQAAARAPGTRVRAARLRADAARGRARHRRHQPRPEADGQPTAGSRRTSTTAST